MGKYKDRIVYHLNEIAKEEGAVFLGYNCKFGSKSYGTLEEISEEKIVEMPVAENLLLGVGVGMAMSGSKPVVCFERHDFILNALDCMVNHLDKMFKVPIIIRAIVGSTKPLDPGVQHCQDYFTVVNAASSNIKCFNCITAEAIDEAYEYAREWKEPVFISEHRKEY